ncbi:hypothetical protein CWI38_0607p0010 [Hamiltosporidium tvaerminnensis]|uniref:Uncharacterized protein n=1 Tax=Hamiltosporidium tvaerminnensis TaxID=1176355 RepID=A0A4Q9LVV2_9MICR|nr:hypothetical protein CWI38_0607p0010 [Hamiltosporidium tvaerminnensis]
MDILPLILVPYKYNYYIKNLDPKNEMKDVILSSPLTLCQGVHELAVVSDGEVVLYTKDDKIGTLTYSDLEYFSFEIKTIKSTVKEMALTFINSYALDLLVFSFKNVYFLLGRYETNIVYFNCCFYLNKTVKYSEIRNIFLCPKNIFLEYQFIETTKEEEMEIFPNGNEFIENPTDLLNKAKNNSEIDENTKDIKIEINTKKTNEEDSDLFDVEMKRIEENESEEYLMKEIEHLKLKRQINNESELKTSYDTKNENLKSEDEKEMKSLVSDRIKKLNAKNTNENVKTKSNESIKSSENINENENIPNDLSNIKNEDNKPKEHLNAKIDEEINVTRNRNVTQETENKPLNVIEHTVKFGKILDKKIYFVKKELQKSFSFDNLPHLKSFIIISILNMSINKYDYFEVRSDTEMFIFKENNSFLLFIYDKVSGEEKNIFEILVNLPTEIEKELKRVNK